MTHAVLTEVGDRATFPVPGGRIQVRLQADGRIQILGTAEMGTHDSALVVQPDVANVVTVALHQDGPTAEEVDIYLQQRGQVRASRAALDAALGGR